MKLYFGSNSQGGRNAQGANVTLDLAEENIHFILLAGDENSGKTFFHRSLYHDLILDATPSTLRFLFIDPSGRDTREWMHSSFLYAPICHEAEESFRVLEKLGEEAESRIFPIPGAYTAIIVHIEENALVMADRARLEACFEHILRHKKSANIFIFYSTTRVDEDLLKDWLTRFVDLRVIFRIENRAKAAFVAGTDLPADFKQAGEHLLVYKGKRIRCAPFQKISSYL